MRKKTVILFLSLIACSGEALDVGEDGNPAANGGTGGAAQDAAAIAALPDWTPVGTCPTTGVDAPQFVGTWEGAIEDFFFNPITPLRLVITKATSDGVCGKLSWDTSKPAPIPLTDPAQSGSDFGFGGSSSQPVPGLTYTIAQGAARDTTLRFMIAGFEHWRDFCSMQTDLHYTPSVYAYTCLEPYSSMTLSIVDSFDTPSDVCVLHTPHGDVDLPLKQCVGCDYRICKCNAESCDANPEPTYGLELSLDQNLEGENIIVSAPVGERAIRLERVQ